jgi:hypothetical protein
LGEISQRVCLDVWPRAKSRCGKAPGEALAISIPRTETAIRHFQERMPYGLFVPDVPCGTFRVPASLPKRSLAPCAPTDERVPETPAQWESGRGSRLEKDKPYLCREPD